MGSDQIIRARINGQIKAEAVQVLEGMGLSLSDAIRMLLVRIAREKALPFEVKVPKTETGV